MESITKRRRFQASITNFFDSHSDDDSTATLPSAASSPSAFPTLPTATQSSLLTVGCRVRKSVPEGYKTHATTSTGFTPRPFMNARLSPATLAAITAPAKYAALTPYAAADPSIHDVGGLLLPAIQPLATATFCGISLQHMPPSTTSAFYSSPSSNQYSNKNKRAFVDDDDSPSSDGDEYDDLDADFIPQLPPSVFSGYLPSPAPTSSTPLPFTSHHRRGSSYPFKHTTMPDLNTLSAQPSTNNPAAYRKIAQPKSRVKTYAPPSPEQENFGFFGGGMGNLGYGACGYQYYNDDDGGSLASEAAAAAAAGGARATDFADADSDWLRQRHEVEMDCS